MKPYRIAVAGMSIEACTFSPAVSGNDAFTMTRGDELLSRYPFLKENDAIEPVPLLRARSMPGGPVAPETYAQVKREIVDGLSRAGALDGVYLDMHGAMYVRGMEDAEGDLITAVREAAGKGTLIAASYDLHGNVSPAVFGGTDILTAYRTAPHVDDAETRERAWRLLIRCLDAGRAPFKAWVPVPVLLVGEKTGTGWEPGAGLYRALADVAHRPDLLDASVLVGYAWADEPRSGASVLAYSFDQAAARKAAIDLAGRFWAVREEFDFGVETGTFDECLDWAERDGPYPVFISDSGDNPTAGGVGDVPFVLGRLVERRPADTVYASIVDPEAAAEIARTGKGNRITVAIGGKIDGGHGKPVRVEGTVLAVESITGIDGRPGIAAVVDAGGVRVIVTERRNAFHRRRQFTELGIDIAKCRIVIVKIGYLEPELDAAAARSYLALTPGAVDQDIARLPYRRVGRPSFPLDPGMVFDPAAAAATGP